MKLTPSLGVMGLFQVKNPFTVNTTKTYTCIAVRTFADIYEKDIDVFKEYYEPLGLDQAYFDDDKAKDPAIITLVNEDQEFVYVPNTHILAMPQMGDVLYQHVILSIDFGAIPEYLDLDVVKDEVANLAGKVIGTVPEVNLHVAKTSGIITPEQHEVMEANRLASVAFNETTYAKLQEQYRRTTELTQRVELYEQMLIDNNIIT